MSGIALALILTGAVLIRGALKGLNPSESVRDVFDRTRGVTRRQEVTSADRAL